jgi:uncharacterized RDD family membrane protein YckC
MDLNIQFETPENIQVAYQPAGLGTRFLAWFVDSILLTVLGIVLFFGLACAGVATENVARQLAGRLEEFEQDMASGDPEKAQQIAQYFIAVWYLAWGLGSFVYYGLSELAMRGQTMGKRLSGIRVVKADGFSLDAGGVFIRNIFRIVDQLPPLWIVPVLSAKSQRFGDMVGGTLVVTDKPQQLTNLRDVLARRTAAESRFRFDNAALDRARPQDLQAVERVLDRWHGLSPAERDTLLAQIVDPLALRLKHEPPDPQDRLQFLEELLAAEYRRQYRKLG